MVIISVDIGIKNLCFHIIKENTTTNCYDSMINISHYKQDPLSEDELIQIFDISINKKQTFLKKGFYNCDIKSLLNKKCFFIITNLIIKYKPKLFVIEKQLNRATNNMFIQTSIESILSICQIKYIEIDPSLKYEELKNKFKIKQIIKSQLIKMIDFNIKNIKIEKIKINDDLTLNNMKIKKYDDAIDCKIISKIYFTHFKLK